MEQRLDQQLNQHLPPIPTATPTAGSSLERLDRPRCRRSRSLVSLALRQEEEARAHSSLFSYVVVKWKESPLFKVVESVTDMVFLKGPFPGLSSTSSFPSSRLPTLGLETESQSQNDRQAAVGPFTLTDDVRQKVERSLFVHFSIASRSPRPFR